MYVHERVRLHENVNVCACVMNVCVCVCVCVAQWCHSCLFMNVWVYICASLILLGHSHLHAHPRSQNHRLHAGARLRRFFIECAGVVSEFNASTTDILLQLLLVSQGIVPNFYARATDILSATVACLKIHS